MIFVLSSVAHFPNAEGVVAPGMTCTYSVKFFPDSLADFEDEIKVSPAKNYSTRYQWLLIHVIGYYSKWRAVDSHSERIPPTT